MTRRIMIAGNWKMNGLKADGLALAGAVADGVGSLAPAAEILICPPATLIDALSVALGDSAVALGGQDCHPRPAGAHTGDVSAAMLKDLGAAYVILGHSERRTDHHESDETVRAKAEAALAAGLGAIVCVGETEAERNAGRTLEVVGRQVAGSLPAGGNAGNLVIAYEPVWAIGTGRTPTIADVAEVHAAIRRLAADMMGGAEAGKLRILYGGSMKPSNAAELLALDDVDGGLIGGASLKAEDFLAIIRIAG